jgi:hypothetical protein
MTTNGNPKVSPATATADAQVDLQACKLYEAECALHTARQAHVDEWIAAAAERLHLVVVAYLAAVAAQKKATQIPTSG